MSQEVFEIVSEMDMKAIETQLALYCAPLITGLKASNLLIIQNEQADDVRKLLEHTQISCFLLFRSEQKSSLLLYRFRLLYRYLLDAPVRELLCQLGYHEFAFEKLLSAFSARYTAYMKGRSKFPHEMGVFLGYPVEDVHGFIENGGKNFLGSGYWKVYQDLAEKAGLFHKYDLAKAALLRLVAHGGSISEAADICSI